MGMNDREKVMWSLARCSCGVPDACSDCYYDNYPPRICVQHLTSDALALLKAQEPRVIPRNDLLKYQDYAWVEFKRASRLGVRDRDDIQFLMTQPETEKEYNKTWRCWTSRPDDKRRAETPWK